MEKENQQKRHRLIISIVFPPILYSLKNAFLHLAPHRSARAPLRCLTASQQLVSQPASRNRRRRADKKQKGMKNYARCVCKIEARSAPPCNSWRRVQQLPQHRLHWCACSTFPGTISSSPSSTTAAAGFSGNRVHAKWWHRTISLKKFQLNQWHHQQRTHSIINRESNQNQKKNCCCFPQLSWINKFI